MPEDDLNLAQVDPLLQQVGGIAVATGIVTLLMNRDAFKFTTLTTPTTVNLSSASAAYAAKVTKRSS